MLVPALTVRFAALPLPTLFVAAGVLALGWEWLRWGFRAGGRWEFRPRRAVGAGLMLGPLAGAGWLFVRDAHWALAAVGAVGVLWILRSYRDATGPLSPRARRRLAWVRSALLILVVLLAARPLAHERVRRPVREGLAVLVDLSRSMARRDAPPDYQTASAPSAGMPATSRLASASQALQAQPERLAALARRYDLRVMGFSSDLRHLPVDEMVAVGEATAIGDAVQLALEGLLAEGLEPAGVLVLTDGNNNTADLVAPLDQAEALASRGVGLWLLGVGSESPSASAALNVRRLQAPDRIDAMNTLAVSADIEAVGLAGQSVTVTCRLGEQVIGTETVEFTDALQSRTVHFRAEPAGVGFHRLTVQATPPRPGPRDLVGQLEAHRLVQVVSRQLRVLYVEGRRRFENKFLARALAGAERFRIDRLILTVARPEAFDADLSDWAGYHVIVLGDVPADRFTQRQLEALVAMVARDGKGLLMIGGPDSFAGGRWHDTPLAGALPVDLPESHGSLAGPVEVRPTLEAGTWELMRLDDEPPALSGAWEGLEPLDGASRLGPAKPAATVLARTPDGELLIVAQPYGAGRTMAIALDATWQWALSPDAQAPMLHRRFWRQVMYYLANPTPNAWVVTDRTEYDQRRLAGGSEEIVISAGVEDSAGQPMPDAPVRLTLTAPDGTESPVLLAADGPVRRGRLPALPAGEYALTLEADAEGRALSASHRFQVVLRDLEGLDVVANLDLLCRMGDSAAPGGGGYSPLRDLDGVLDYFLTGRPVPYSQRLIVHDPLGEYRWLLLTALLALAITEWAARKRLGGV